MPYLSTNTETLDAEDKKVKTRQNENRHNEEMLREWRTGAEIGGIGTAHQMSLQRSLPKEDSSLFPRFLFPKQRIALTCPVQGVGVSELILTREATELPLVLTSRASHEQKWVVQQQCPSQDLYPSPWC